MTYLQRSRPRRRPRPLVHRPAHVNPRALRHAAHTSGDADKNVLSIVRRRPEKGTRADQREVQRARAGDNNMARARWTRLWYRGFGV